MGLETTTYISGLTASWPVSTDQKSQGDDHLRLLKTTLQNTFPTATRPFYFPVTSASTATVNLTAADQNNMVMLDTTAGNVTVNLPGALGVGDKGWSCEVIKTSNDANAGIVTPSSGTIASKCGATATIRVGILCEPARFIWNGTGWTCSKPGTMIGSTENFDGATVPPGYLLDDGSSFSNTAFAELFAVLGSSTLRDKRGRVEAGVDAAGVRLTTSVNGFGAVASLGVASGAEMDVLLTGHLPPYTPAGTILMGGNYPWGGSNVNVNIATPTSTVPDVTPSALASYANKPTATWTGTPQGGTNTPVRKLQPTIIVNKIKRAC